ncbi:MAG: LPXTG cell wall anchor domain-containing protein [Clostridia bacterium]|jgi:LPXTG-motif cell wall-anchored protein|nr:LPXTG cell wall anchor domain-containing protein [Clostridia bacterium]MCI9412972.1 LPXTG cell wall anchor domain-containing protein [Clostridia bacterium]
MMKNKKLIIVFMLVITFLALMVTFTKATDDVGQLPTIDQGNNPTNQDKTNNTPAPIANNNVEPVTNNGTSGNTLPQTGVAGDTALFVFIGVCVASAIYAYFRIRKYNNVH